MNYDKRRVKEMQWSFVKEWIILIDFKKQKMLTKDVLTIFHFVSLGYAQYVVMVMFL